jgi:hypothetical protein
MGEGHGFAGLAVKYPDPGLLANPCEGGQQEGDPDNDPCFQV